MKILLVHNSYLHAGGEDVVVAAEAQLLAAHGHRIIWYRRDNDELPTKPGLRGVAMGITTIWASDSYRALKEILRRETPDVVHFHNTFPLISPAGYYTCADAGVPVIQTLHNYRLLCPGAIFFRGGSICEKCIGRTIPWPGVVHGCYRDSRLATAAVTGMLTAHRALGSWQTKVDCYIAVSEFARNLFIRGGLPRERIWAKPNSVHPDPGAKDGPGKYALFVGRLSEEKGVRVLLEAWSRLATPIPLLVAGHGPMAAEVAAAVERIDPEKIRLLGSVTHDDVLSLMHDARFLVFPSVCYEVAPLSIVEAFACGLPVVASNVGAMAETVRDGYMGLQFASGSPEDLATKVEWAWTHPNEMEEMGQGARSEYEKKYTPERNYQTLMSIYQFAIDGRWSVGKDSSCKDSNVEVSS